MAQLTIEIPDELAQKIAPFQDQISNIVAAVFQSSFVAQSISTNFSNSPLPVESPTYLEIIDFLANRPTSEQVVNFKVSERSQSRLQLLLQKNREDALNASEIAELDLFEQLDVLMTMLKIKSYKSMQSHKVDSSDLA